MQKPLTVLLVCLLSAGMAQANTRTPSELAASSTVSDRWKQQYQDSADQNDSLGWQLAGNAACNPRVKVCE